jgi:hypothetical protein
VCARALHVHPASQQMATRGETIPDGSESRWRIDTGHTPILND